MVKKKNKYQVFVEDELSNKDTVKLSETSLISDLGEEAQAALAALYENPNIDKKRIGTMVNSMITHQSHVFLNSIRIFEELIKNDLNTDIKSCHSSKYKAIMHLLLRKKIIKILRAPTGRKAGLYELIAQIFLDIIKDAIGQDMLDAKKEANIKWYDEEYLKNTHNDDSEVDVDIKEGDAVKERMNERKRKKDLLSQTDI